MATDDGDADESSILRAARAAFRKHLGLVFPYHRRTEVYERSSQVQLNRGRRPLELALLIPTHLWIRVWQHRRSHPTQERVERYDDKEDVLRVL